MAECRLHPRELCPFSAPEHDESRTEESFLSCATAAMDNTFLSTKLTSQGSVVHAPEARACYEHI
jgi:hypothetical protein